MEFKDSGKRIRIIIILVFILLIPFVFYMRKEYRLSRSKELFGRIKEYELAGRYKKALETLEEAKELNPENPEIRTKIGELYLRTERRDEGLKILKEVILEYPSFADAYYHLAFYYYNEQKYEESRKYWKGFLKVNRDPLYEDIARRRISEIEKFLGENGENSITGD